MLSRDLTLGQPTAARGSRTWWLLGLVAQREWRVSQLLLGLELRQLLSSRAMWAMVGMSALLTAFNFSQAVAQYSHGGIDPLEGIVVPTFGAIYLMNTFLLPFVAIRVVGNDPRHGALKLLLQLPVGAARLVAIKLCALALAWSLAAAPALGALAVWLGLGGHLTWPEVGTVLLGHALYALVIAGVAFLAGAVAESSATAAIVALSFTLGSWSLELAASSSTSTLVRAIGSFSLLPALRAMERGLLGSPNALTLLVLALGFLALAVVWLPAGKSWRKKLLRSGAVLGVAAQAVLLVIQLPLYVDVTENQRNSLAPAEARLLSHMTGELMVSVDLAANDPRLSELERDALGKLQRAMPHVSVSYSDAGSGQVTYAYGGKQAVSRATSAREVVPLIFRLGGMTPPPAESPAVIRAYPLQPDAKSLLAKLLPLAAGLALIGAGLVVRKLRFDSNSQL